MSKSRTGATIMETLTNREAKVNLTTDRICDTIEELYGFVGINK